MLLSKVAVAAGGIWILAYLLGAIRFEPTTMVGAIAAIIGGVVVFGSNLTTSKQTTATMKAAERHRAELIDIVDLRTVGASGDGLVRNRDAAKFYRSWTHLLVLQAIRDGLIEPIMTDVNTEIIWCVFGNLLHSVGPFRECFGRFSHRWQGWHVDARNVDISDKKQIAEWAEDHAEDSYFFMTRVRGEFPTASALQFIPTDLVEDAMTREIVRQPNDPLILGVDVARFGDDCSVLYARRGLDARSILPMVFRGISTDRLEDKILEFCSQNRVEVIFIDGAGVGGGVVDHLRNRHNLPVEDIQFGGKADRGDQVKYAQKRSEMWGNLRDALKYLAIPHSSELRDQLVGPEYDFNLKGELQLEKKSDMKRRGLASPDIADALALTYARPVFPRAYDDWMSTGSSVVSEYDPFSDASLRGQPQAPPRYYAPGWARMKESE